MAAFHASAMAGADMLELDVRLTSDGHLVAHHDSSLVRTAGVSGRIEDLTLEQLRSLDVGSHFESRFARERIPTLKEVLDWAKGRVKVLLDLKLDRGGEGQVVEEVVIRNMELDVVLGSRTIDALRTIKALCPSIRTLSFARSLWATQDMVDARVEIVRLWRDWVTPAHVQRFHDMGLPVWVMTGGRNPIDVGEASKEGLVTLRAAAVDGVILNDPRLAIAMNCESPAVAETSVLGAAQPHAAYS
jgi:glycerophosphoryl diester phosphodiesterase